MQLKELTEDRPDIYAPRVGRTTYGTYEIVAGMPLVRLAEDTSKKRIGVLLSYFKSHPTASDAVWEALLKQRGIAGTISPSGRLVALDEPTVTTNK